MSPDAAEKRKYFRVYFPCKVVVGSPTQIYISHTENISEDGLKIFVEERVLPSTVVTAEVFFEKNKAFRCKAKVSWMKEFLNPLERKPVIYELGLQFIDMKPADKEYLRKLIAILNTDK